jgi:hypothetical protein
MPPCSYRAAFFDKAEVVGALLDFGISAGVLDRLILCELRCDTLANEAQSPGPGGPPSDHGAVTWAKLFGPGSAGELGIVARTLPLGGRGMYRSSELCHHSWVMAGFPKTQGGRLSPSRVEKAFARWITAVSTDGTHATDANDMQQRWQQEWGAMYDKCSSIPLSCVHRIWWAVVTRRYRVAQLLVSTATDGLTAAFGAAWAFRNLPDTHMNEEERENRANGYDSQALQLMQIFSSKADRRLETACLQQYLYFGHADSGGDDGTSDVNVETDDSDDGNGRQQSLPPALQRLWSEPRLGSVAAWGSWISSRGTSACGRSKPQEKESQHPLYACLSPSRRRANASLRDAMALMGFGSADGLPITRLDLACASKSKLILAHDCAEEFLDSLWTRPS